MLPHLEFAAFLPRVANLPTRLEIYQTSFVCVRVSIGRIDLSRGTCVRFLPVRKYGNPTQRYLLRPVVSSRYRRFFSLANIG